MNARTFACLLVPLALSACRPSPPPTEHPPEPQAARATELRDAIQAPLEKAKAAEEAARKAADDQRAVLDAAGQ